MEKAMKTPFDTPVVCPVLIGREADLAALRSLTDRAKNGEGQVALLSGEAGVGKSRLVTEIKVYAAAQGFLLLQGNCFPLISLIPTPLFSTSCARSLLTALRQR